MTTSKDSSLEGPAEQEPRGADKESKLGSILGPLEDPRVAGAVSALVVGGLTQIGNLPWESQEGDRNREPEPKQETQDAPHDPDAVHVEMSMPGDVARDLNEGGVPHDDHADQSVEPADYGSADDVSV
jgi:hypothetical protein